MHPGKIIADVFAFMLLALLLAGMFLLFARPLWPVHEARMVILLPRTDHGLTGPTSRDCAAPCLPRHFALKLAPQRPRSRDVARNQQAGNTVY